MFGQQVMSGLATGSLYALTAVAVVVVFRNTRTINLAQGDFSMIGAFVDKGSVEGLDRAHITMPGSHLSPSNPWRWLLLQPAASATSSSVMPIALRFAFKSSPSVIVVPSLRSPAA